MGGGCFRPARPAGRIGNRHPFGRQRLSIGSHVGDFFRHHDDRRIDIAADDVGHDRGIDDAQAFDTMDAPLAVEPGDDSRRDHKPQPPAVAVEPGQYCGCWGRWCDRFASYHLWERSPVGPTSGGVGVIRLPHGDSPTGPGYHPNAGRTAVYISSHPCEGGAGRLAPPLAAGHGPRAVRLNKDGAHRCAFIEPSGRRCGWVSNSHAPGAVPLFSRRRCS